MPRSLSFVACASVASALTLTTRSRVPNATPEDLQQFLATPANWPRIVLSSVGVEGASTAAPLRPGAEVDELFGLPPVLPLRVKCREKIKLSRRVFLHSSTAAFRTRLTA
jgi:hypothetical protein